ncbi:Glucan endo-1,3-beta-glucosidase 2 [Hibiscus syriacus]|uniref:glucan endo-1,3-beta-D-glucosidase n=1 Tax=Hibiscus syriacus TaxID=106335 RepID=A0A6A3A0N9_HIBSY|nr:glucan endo-1,3-beta-glucosidase 2-like [Hibiscus syriacus]KAE8696902.1 Glucan endo-1,3-beta-glucosidase 2 [Hibiscus syriacus]
MALLLLLFLLLEVSQATAGEDPYIGVNIGTDLSDMPHPTQVVALLKAQQIRHVRLYNADQAMLVALADTGIRVMVTIPNEQLLGIGQSNSTAANWVTRNVVAHYPATNITAICVGSEVLTALPNAGPVLVNAIKFVHSALAASNLDKRIKVSSPLSSTVILDPFPPSQAFFNRSWNPVLVPMLDFLQSTGSFLMLNMYPYYDYMQSNGAIPLDYALFKPLTPKMEAIDSNTLVHYTNVFDATVDATYFAMDFLNFTNIPVTVTETGWPSKGDSKEPDATMENANTYNSNLIRRVMNKTGTPKHPGIAVSTYIYELYNEDMKPGPTSEKNWGLFEANGDPVYILRLTGSGSLLANDTTNQTYCTAKDGADQKMLQAALDWACGPGKVDCSPLLQGKPCYEPDNVIAHATYAFNTYYHRMGKTSDACDFNGVADITTTDPSHGSCTFPGRNGTMVNITTPSMNSVSSDSSGPRFYDRGGFTGILVLIKVMLRSAIFLCVF